MKKLMALSLVFILLISFAAVEASAESTIPSNSLFTKVNVKTNSCTYETPDAKAGGYGQPWYDDDEGQQKLFDGVIPTDADLEAAKDEKHALDDTINEYWAWEGWIALAKNYDALIKGQKVNIDFEFELEITLAEVEVYACAMTTGSVGIPKAYYIYVSTDGENWNKTAVGKTSGSGTSYSYVQETASVTLDTPVKTRFVRLVMDASDGAAWTFLSEVEFYENLKADTAPTAAEVLEKESSGEESTASSEDSAVSEASDTSSAAEASSQAESASESASGSESSEASTASKSDFTLPSDNDEGSSFPLWAWIVIGCAAAAAVAAVIIVAVKKKKA